MPPQQLGEELGRGASGRVYRAFNRETGEFCAIKEIPIKDMPESGLRSVQSEIELLHTLQHERIVRCYETVRASPKPNLALTPRMLALTPTPNPSPSLVPNHQQPRPQPRPQPKPKPKPMPTARPLSQVRTSDHLYIVLELMGNGSLASVVKKFGRLPESLVATYARQVLCIRTRA